MRTLIYISTILAATVFAGASLAQTVGGPGAAGTGSNIGAGTGIDSDIGLDTDLEVDTGDDRDADGSLTDTLIAPDILDRTPGIDIESPLSSDDDGLDVDLDLERNLDLDEDLEIELRATQGSTDINAVNAGAISRSNEAAAIGATGATGSTATSADPERLADDLDGSILDNVSPGVDLGAIRRGLAAEAAR